MLWDDACVINGPAWYNRHAENCVSDARHLVLFLSFCIFFWKLVLLHLEIEFIDSCFTFVIISYYIDGSKWFWHCLYLLVPSLWCGLGRMLGRMAFSDPHWVGCSDGLLWCGLDRMLGWPMINRRLCCFSWFKFISWSANEA